MQEIILGTEMRAFPLAMTMRFRPPPAGDVPAATAARRLALTEAEFLAAVPISKDLSSCRYCERGQREGTRPTPIGLEGSPTWIEAGRPL